MKIIWIGHAHLTLTLVKVYYIIASFAASLFLFFVTEEKIRGTKRERRKRQRKRRACLAKSHDPLLT